MVAYQAEADHKEAFDSRKGRVAFDRRRSGVRVQGVLARRRCVFGVGPATVKAIDVRYLRPLDLLRVSFFFSGRDGNIPYDM